MKFSPWGRLRATAEVLGIATPAYDSQDKSRESSRENTTKIPLNLAELPEEIILQIFQHIHDTPIPDTYRKPDHDGWNRYDEGTRSIQKVRLTCQLFNRISSELLVKSVAVDVSSESLTRLQAIMQHPTIGKGVRMIRIRLQAYDWILAQSFDRYATEAMRELELSMRFRDSKAVRLAVDYEVAWGLHAPRGLPGIRAALEPAYAEYVRRYQVQHNLPKQQFIVDVAHALKMSTKPLNIKITDHKEPDVLLHWRSTSQATTRGNVLDLVSRPRASTWEQLDRRAPNLDRSFAFMIPLMLAAFADDRIHINDLHFDISGISRANQKNLAAMDMDKEMIQKAMRNLQSFSYTNGVPLRGRELGKELTSVLYNCLPPDSLQNLRLDLVELDSQHLLPKLTNISLHVMEISAQQLSVLLRPLEPHSVTICLPFCNVRTGSWADILDLLRSYLRPQRQPVLAQPNGMEFARSNYAPWAEMWQAYHEDVSKANKYVQGLCDINPLRRAEQ